MIEIKPISELFDCNFIIPNYQRGYRWGKQEIEELLSDLFEYAQSNENDKVKHSKFYCLQPVVVIKKEENKFELVDGQQRLTTIRLILNYLKDVKEIMFPDDNSKPYSLEYQTREGSSSFLADELYIRDTSLCNKYIDFYYISEAYKTIDDWFKKPENKGAKGKIITILLNPKSQSNVSVIWYQISTEDKSTPIELFTRLNQGKIPLTDAELIKALLLQSDKYPDDKKELYGKRLFEIASEWDDIEKKLNDERFWYFLAEKMDTYSSRIELIFELLAKKWNKDDKFDIKDNMKHFIYIVFDNHLKCLRKKDSETVKPYDIADIDCIWREVTRIFNQFYYWYTNHKFYHYIGYLIAFPNSKIKLAELLDLSQNLGKEAFEYKLKSKIGESIKIIGNNNTVKSRELLTLHYGEDDDKIRTILLLFNVDAMIKNECENSKFPFNLYKIQQITSLEHIHPQNPEPFDTKEERAKIWLTEQSNELILYKKNLPQNANDDIENEIKEQINEINEFLQNDYDKNNFIEIFRKTIELSSKVSEFKDNEKHTLYNLALIDKDTNSSLNNSFFDIKRNILKYKTKKYVPVCTIRAFEKYYSKSPQEMIFWSSEDRKDYFSAIEEVYNHYCSFIER